MFTVKILNSCFLGSMVYMYVVHWMLDSWYRIKFSLIIMATMVMMMIMMKVMMIVDDDNKIQY